MSEFQSTGLSIIVFDPLVKTDRSAYIENLTNKIDSYSHELRREGGYFSASIRFSDSEEAINDWIQNGIGRHIEVDNQSQVRVFEGFVNQITVNQGESSFSIGPLTDICNQLYVTYSTIDTTTNPPTLGVQITTSPATNDVSIALYGIWEKKKSINGATAADATQLRDMFLADPTRAFPAISGDLGRGGSFDISLEILGYWHWLKSYYGYDTSTGDIDLSQKIENVCADQLNTIFDTSSNQSFLKVTENTTQVSASSSEDQTAETILKDLNSRGDASNNPYSIGFYAGRRIVYAPIPTTIEYQQRRGQPLTDELDGPIQPWDILPAKWVFRPDFLVGRHLPITAETLGTDPRAFLIDVVKYSSPYTVSVSGRKFSQLDQMLAKRGIGGMS